MAAKKTQGTTVTIQGKDFDFESLTLDELEEIEEACGGSLETLDWSRAKVIKHVAFTFLKRDNPKLTLADIGAMNFKSLMSQNGNGAGPDNR